MNRLALGTLVSSVFLAACGSSPPPASSLPASPSSSAPADVASAAPRAPDPEPSAHHGRPLDVNNACSAEVHLYYGEQPGDGKGQSATVPPGATVPVPRGPDGTVVVWVVDEKGFGLASVHVTRGIRHVYFDSSCKRIEADSTR